jgi:hypothetical protein
VADMSTGLKSETVRVMYLSRTQLLGPIVKEQLKSRVWRPVMDEMDLYDPLWAELEQRPHGE